MASKGPLGKLMDAAIGSLKDPVAAADKAIGQARGTAAVGLIIAGQVTRSAVEKAVEVVGGGAHREPVSPSTDGKRAARPASSEVADLTSVRDRVAKPAAEPTKPPMRTSRSPRPVADGPARAKKAPAPAKPAARTVSGARKSASASPSPASGQAPAATGPRKATTPPVTKATTPPVTKVTKATKAPATKRAATEAAATTSARSTGGDEPTVTPADVAEIVSRRPATKATKKTAAKKTATKKTATKKTATKPAASRTAAKKPATGKSAAQRTPATTSPATARQVADVEDGPEVTTPVGTPAADVATNPDTTDHDLQQPGTEPLLDPGTAKAVRSEQQTLSRAADPDKG